MSAQPKQGYDVVAGSRILAERRAARASTMLGALERLHRERPSLRALLASPPKLT